MLIIKQNALQTQQFENLLPDERCQIQYGYTREHPNESGVKKQLLGHLSSHLTSAPLLSRIMKMMKLSNQLCSTIRKQVFLIIHHTFHQPTSAFTWQHLNFCTQPE